MRVLPPPPFSSSCWGLETEIPGPGAVRKARSQCQTASVSPCSDTGGLRDTKSAFCTARGCGKIRGSVATLHLLCSPPVRTAAWCGRLHITAAPTGVFLPGLSPLSRRAAATVPTGCCPHTCRVSTAHSTHTCPLPPGDRQASEDRRGNICMASRIEPSPILTTKSKGK